MEAIIEILEKVVMLTAEIGIKLVELVGILVLLYTVFRAIYGCITHDTHVRLQLAQGIALALEFKLGGEVLRTVTTRTWDEIAMLGGIIALRGALTLLLHWEIKNEEGRVGEHIEIASKLHEAKEKGVDLQQYAKKVHRLKAQGKPVTLHTHTEVKKDS